ncbi:hypothetical protein GAW91_004301 [Vibrio fluvialis]|nr:hypothetical protein [Vibrio fluvialis]
MSEEKDVLIKINCESDEDEELLTEFLELAEEIGLIPDEIRRRNLPDKPKRINGNSTKDVQVTVVGEAEDVESIMSEFLERAKKEIGVTPSSRNKKLLGK